jgi:hypothetical protein
VLSKSDVADTKNNSSNSSKSKGSATAPAAAVVVTVRADTLWRSTYDSQQCTLYEPRTAPLVCMNKSNSSALWLNSKLQQTSASTELLQLVGVLMAIAPLNQCVLRHDSVPTISPLLFALVMSDTASGAVKLADIEHLNSTLVDAMR